MQQRGQCEQRVQVKGTKEWVSGDEGTGRRKVERGGAGGGNSAAIRAKRRDSEGDAGGTGLGHTTHGENKRKGQSRKKKQFRGEKTLGDCVWD